MAKIVKRDAPPEVALQKLETLMNELGISIESNTEIYVTFNNVKMEVIDSETHENIQVLPRQMDFDRLAIWG